MVARTCVARAGTALTGMALSTPVSATPTSAGPAEDNTHCVTVLDPAQPGQSSSQVLSRTCAQGEAAQQLPRPQQDTLLTTLYDEPGYAGGSEEIYDDEGPCDPDGYGFTDVSGAVGDGIASYTLHGRCAQSELFTDTDFEGQPSGLLFGGNQPAVARGFEHNVGSMYVYRF